MAPYTGIMGKIIVVFVTFISLSTCSHRESDQIEYIDFSYLQGMYGYSILIKGDSFHIHIDECDSIGDGKGKLDKYWFDSIQKLINKIPGTRTDNDIHKPEREGTYFRLIIGRQHSRLSFYGEDKWADPVYIRVKEMMVEFRRNLKGEPGPSVKYQSAVPWHIKEIYR